MDTLTVYLSHAGEPDLKDLDNPTEITFDDTITLANVLSQLNDTDDRAAGYFIDEDTREIGSNAAVYTSVDVQSVEATSETAIYESDATRSIQGLSEELTADDSPILLATFNPQHILEVLEDAMTETSERFQDAESTRGRTYRTFIDELPSGDDPVRTLVEPLYPFETGQKLDAFLSEDEIDPSADKYIPAPLRDAIAQLWELDTEDDDITLRLFQEEALQRILGEMHREDSPNPLLLSIPTGGGKTEAFLIPLVAHLYDARRQILANGSSPHDAVRSIVMYPTRALANDQARRIAEVLHYLNEGQPDDQKVTVGVLTGDTDWSRYGNFGVRNSLLQTCPGCGEALTEFDTSQSFVMARCSCGVTIDFFRFSRNDILDHPPDILVTSPDMINRMLQSPQYHGKIFSPDIDMVVFDEIHVYESVFGCNVAHLLRRLEDACGTKPMYTGVSATINNAKELACLIFDADVDDTLYLRPAREDEAITEEKRPYLNYDAGPTRQRLHATLAAPNKNVTSTLNVVDALAHMIRDPHFRKTLIFANYRNDTDDLIRYLRDQEDRYYATYRDNLAARIQQALDRDGSMENLTFSDAEQGIVKSVDRWYRRAEDGNCLYTPKLQIGWHRGGLERDERIKAVNRFSTSRMLGDERPIDVMVATRTLELGIDIGDVSTVVNNGSPATTNEYSQRIGRGGRKRDGLALTVVDSSNPLDLYFLRNFESFVLPTEEDFEDAPIIISNPKVLRSHLYARILDWMAREFAGPDAKDSLTVKQLKTLTLFADGGTFRLQDDPKAFATALFDKLLPPERFDRLNAWVRRESVLIPDVAETQLDRDVEKNAWVDLLVGIEDKMEKRDGGIDDRDRLNGMDAVVAELVPNLRNSGASTSLLLVREGSDDEEKDRLPLKQAIRSAPPKGHASQGSMSYRIEEVKSQNYDESKTIRRLFARSDENHEMAEYFHQMFGNENNESPFPQDPIDVLTDVADFVVPTELNVKYRPYRFYCANCGATYSNKQAGDDRCTICYDELRQLTEIYLCDGCGNIYQPPVPKVCLNPDCIEHALQEDDTFYQKVANDGHNKHFRFRALPNLHWECRRCGMQINYHQFYNLPSIVKNNVADQSWRTDDPTPLQIASVFLNRPEAYIWKGSKYKDRGFNFTRFNCRKCKEAGTYCRIRASNIPSIRAEIHDYQIPGDPYASDQTLGAGNATYPFINLLSLGREYYQRFYSFAENTNKIDHGEVFSEDNRYLANRYETHGAYLSFGETLDPFLAEHDQAQACLSGTCSCIPYNPSSLAEDEGEVRTSPQPRLLEWERNRKPDPRRKWCSVIRGDVDAKCPDPEGRGGCKGCKHFDRTEYLRYLTLHTLKHAIILAMPRYTGINRFDIQGTLYPNDRKDADIALIDQTEGGSGSLYLFRKNWDKIWAAAGELLEVAVEEEGRLILAYGCSRYNCDLCPELALAYHTYASEHPSDHTSPEA